MTFAPPVDALNRGHATLWGNLGDWSHTSDYVGAARALARRLGTAADLHAGHDVVDLGSGAGDQLRMWVQDFGVNHVTAVERDPALAGRAAERIRAWGLGSSISIVVGEASAARWTEGVVDRVVALDSAYFFESRSAFFGRCRDVLRPDGLLALTDLLVGDGATARVVGAVAPLFGVRGGDLRTEPRYRAMLTENGFDDIRIHDCTDDVLGGFSRWARDAGRRCGEALPLPTRIGLAMTGRAAGFLGRPGGLRYVVTTARRRCR